MIHETRVMGISWDILYHEISMKLVSWEFHGIFTTMKYPWIYAPNFHGFLIHENHMKINFHGFFID